MHPRLFDHLSALGIVTSRRAYDHILKQYEGRYWRARGHYLYLVGYRALSEKLVTLALTSRAELVNVHFSEKHDQYKATNAPGRRKVYVDLSGSLKEAQARAYAAWIADREKVGIVVTGTGETVLKHNGLQISRETLCRLWKRQKATLLEWEAIAGVHTAPNYAQADDPAGAAVPDHAYLCRAKDGKDFPSWLLPNTYHAPAIEQHNHAGNRRKIRAAVNAVVETFDEPVFERADGAQPTGWLYFTDRLTKRGYVPAVLALMKHLRKHHDAHDRRHYIRLGRNSGGTIHQYCDDQPRPAQVRDFQAERTPAFVNRKVHYRIAWSTR